MRVCNPSGVGGSFCEGPRVARSSQPWAGGSIPFGDPGIPERHGEAKALREQVAALNLGIRGSRSGTARGAQLRGGIVF